MRQYHELVKFSPPHLWGEGSLELGTLAVYKFSGVNIKKPEG